MARLLMWRRAVSSGEWNDPKPVFRRLEYALRHAAFRPHSTRALPAGLRLRDTGAGSRDRRDLQLRRGAELRQYDRSVGAQRPSARAGEPSLLQSRCEQHQQCPRGNRPGLRAAARPASDARCPRSCLVRAHRESLFTAREPRARSRPAAADRALLPPLRSQRCPADPRTKAANGDDLRAAGEFAHRFWSKRPSRRAGLAADPGRGGPGGPAARSGAARAAEERGFVGRYAVTLARSAVEPFLTFSTRRDLRRKLWEAWTARGARGGSSDNAPIIREILAARAEQARLLGYENFAEYRLDDSMAKTSAAVERLLLQVWEPAKARARAELAAIEAVAGAEGLNEPIEPWDWRYYAEKVRQAQYNFDEAEAKPYFVLDDMVQAAFGAAGRLFGVIFTERKNLPVYHPDVRVWEVCDESGGHVGLFLHDNFARPGKRSGAWSSRYRDQENMDEPVAPIVVNNNNFVRGDAAAGEPTLLSFDDARTLFHEFGHGLHSLLSRVRYRSQS